MGVIDETLGSGEYAPEAETGEPAATSLQESLADSNAAGSDLLYEDEDGQEGSTEGVNKEQKNSAKVLIKDFVSKMVKGRKLTAILPNGQVRVCFCALSRGLDKLQIRANER